MIRFVVLFCLGAFSAHANSLSGVGRIENPESGGSCSATLVRENVLITAAHCVGDGPIEGMHFRPGYAPDAETVPITRAIHHPLYATTRSRPIWHLRFDIAVVELASPVPADRASALEVGDEAQPGEDLFLVSWRNDGSSRPRQRRCKVLNAAPGLVTTACDVRGGESGAALVRLTQDGPRLVAVISSRSNLGTQPVAYASDVRLRLEPLLNALAENP